MPARVSLLPVLLLSLCAAAGVARAELTASATQGKFEKVRLSKQSYESVHRLHTAWYHTSIKALMGQLGKELYWKLDKEGKTDLARCLDAITDQNDLTHGARCLMKAKARKPRKGWRLDKYGPKKRTKRSPYRLVDDAPKIKVKQQDRLHSLLQAAPSSPIKRVSNLITRVTTFKNNSDYSPGAWSKSYELLQELKKDMDEKKSQPGAKVYEMRLYDIVLGNEEPSKPRNRPDTIFTRAADLANVLTNDRRKGTQNLRLLSPRFAPIMPDKMKGGNRPLSPSILSFYKDESDDEIASIPRILEATGMDESDRKTVVETIMEVSGARGTVDMALDILKKMNFLGLEGELFEVTNRLTDAFKALQSTFNKKQNKELDRRGFTFMETNQIQKIYRDHGIHDANDVNFDIDEYANLTRVQREKSLWKRIELIAHNISDSEYHHRAKRTFDKFPTWKTLSVLSPTVLAPYMFAPVFGLSVLGPTVLSPNIFSPLLLNPSVLGPFVLSPAVAMPFIVSPYLLSPYVLTPIVMAPFILNPYILSPNVINPYILSPLILSPYVLCPDVLSPQTLGGAILSPSVASPSVLTESTLMASVLSPTFLS
uniref:WSN domain-containing protein n=1 Tax=Steinernema glaseri TaxID=37863 RepID=A0A1I7YV75_9BILA